MSTPVPRGMTLETRVPDPGSPEEMERLDPRVVWLWRWRGVLGWAMLVPAGVLAALLLGGPVSPGVAAAGLLPVAVAWIIFLPPLRYRAWGYRVRAADLVIRRGVVWRTTSVVPHARIQHVDSQSGPLERGLGLARVLVHTAAVRGGALEVPGLAAGDAAALRERLAEVSGLEDV